MLRSLATLRNYITYITCSHAHDRTPLLAYHRFESRDESTIERRGNRRGRNGIETTYRSGSGDLRTYVISSSPARASSCAYNTHAHARIAEDAWRIHCGSIISQKSDNCFVNAFAAFIPQTYYVILDSKMWKRSLCRLLETPPVFFISGIFFNYTSCRATIKMLVF